MKIQKRFINTFNSLKESIYRFPIPISLSIVLVMTLIYLQEKGDKLSVDVLNNYQRFSMTIGLGILLFICISLLKERITKEKIKEIFLYIVGIVIMIVFYFIILKEIDFESIIRYLGSISILILVFSYVSRWKKEEAYEKYIIRLFFNFFESALYSAVLLFGIFAIIFTINQLFDANINGKWYYYTFLIDFLIFGLSLFLSKVPKKEEGFSHVEYSKSLKILLAYIVIPLISIYTVILYIYFIKILILWEWPRGLVSHLVLWYSLISVALIFFTTPLIEEQRIIKLFKVLFPKLILPILIMMFISIGQRVNQYGFTENRYFVLVLGLWVTGIMVYFSLKKPLRNIIIPISLSLVVLNSVFGPLSSISVSKISQNNRLENILERNHMLSDHKIVKKESINKKDKEEINNIISYFKDSHKLKDIKVLSDDFKLQDMEETFGFEFNEYNRYQPQEYFYYSRVNENNSINIKKYDYLLEMTSWSEEVTKMDELVVKMEDRQSLTISKLNEKIITVDLREFVKENYDQILSLQEYGKINNGEIVKPLYFENEKIKGEMIVKDIGGELNKTNEEITIDVIEFLLLIKEK